MRKLKSKEEIKNARLRDRLVIETAQDAGSGASKYFALARACSLVCEAHPVPRLLGWRTASRLSTALDRAREQEHKPGACGPHSGPAVHNADDTDLTNAPCSLAPAREEGEPRDVVPGWAAYLPSYCPGTLREAAAVLAEQCAQAFYLIDLLASDPGPQEDHDAWFLETCVNPATMEPYDNWAYRAWLRAQKLIQDITGQTDHPDPQPVELAGCSDLGYAKA